MAWVESLSEEELNSLLSAYDATEPALQRRVVAQLTLNTAVADELLDLCRILLVYPSLGEADQTAVIAHARDVVDKSSRVLGG